MSEKNRIFTIKIKTDDLTARVLTMLENEIKRGDYELSYEDFVSCAMLTFEKIKKNKITPSQFDEFIKINLKNEESIAEA